MITNAKPTSESCVVVVARDLRTVGNSSLLPTVFDCGVRLHKLAILNITRFVSLEDLSVLGSTSALVKDRDSEWELRFPLASSVHAVGFHVRSVCGQLVLHAFTHLFDRDHGRRWLAYTTNHLFVVEALIREQVVNLDVWAPTQLRTYSTVSFAISALRPQVNANVTDFPLETTCTVQ